ncbi:hypothetical protein PLEOSDRAFT_158823 [Pleurotus ostreatus PC15]|uniref:Uncharacterized protein n=1 Tax=Pleurotus ostreatus (strain PC15) TaxID=1137138 RepID=A0A067NGY2_PLEO1|nr:hypothetical protein PLEOSDRAFT_158823 [Pleurotus ostreatus PC15]
MHDAATIDDAALPPISKFQVPTLLAGASMPVPISLYFQNLEPIMVSHSHSTCHPELADFDYLPEHAPTLPASVYVHRLLPRLATAPQPPNIGRADATYLGAYVPTTYVWTLPTDAVFGTHVPDTCPRELEAELGLGSWLRATYVAHRRLRDTIMRMK